jgi:hypothetical protein
MRTDSDLAQTRVLRLDSERHHLPIRKLQTGHRNRDRVLPALPDDRNERKALGEARRWERRLGTDILAGFMRARDLHRREGEPDVSLGPVLVGLNRLGDLVRWANVLEHRTGDRARPYVDASARIVARSMYETDWFLRDSTMAEDAALAAITADEERRAWLSVGLRNEPPMHPVLLEALEASEPSIGDRRERARRRRGNQESWLLHRRVVLPVLARWVAEPETLGDPQGALFPGCPPTNDHVNEVLAGWVLRHTDYFDDEDAGKPFESWSPW